MKNRMQSLRSHMLSATEARNITGGRASGGGVGGGYGGGAGVVRCVDCAKEALPCPSGTCKTVACPALGTNAMECLNA